MKTVTNKEKMMFLEWLESFEDYEVIYKTLNDLRKVFSEDEILQYAEEFFEEFNYTIVKIEDEEITIEKVL